MKFKRLISADQYKGEKHYLRIQRNYEIAKTVILFLLAIIIFAIGMIIYKDKANIFTIVAVLGCLPACNSLVHLILFLRYKTLDDDISDNIEQVSGELIQAYDRIFTSKDKNFRVDHLAINNNCICGITTDKKFSDADFQKHIQSYLKAENIKDTTIKIFTDEKKYIDRLNTMSIENTTAKDKEILRILLSISL